MFGLAARLGAQWAQTPLGRGLVILLWCLAALLAAGVVVFVGKRLGGLSLLAAMLTDYGRAARFGGRPPVWLDDPPANALRITHLSDLHITEGPDVRMVEKDEPGGNQALQALLSRPEVQESDLVLLTGDVTDRGTAISWRAALDALTEHGLTDRAVLVPGNHDLAVVDPWGGLRSTGNRWRRNDRFGVVQLANLLKFAESFAETGGGKRGFVLSRDKELVRYEQAWLEAERAVRPLIAALPSMPVPKQRLGAGWLQRRSEILAYEARIIAARKRLLALFPIAVPMPGHDAVVFVLNSCTPVSRHPATNALGRIGRAQYKRLDALAGFFGEHLKLVGLHHHVVRRTEEQGRGFIDRLMAKFTVLSDASPLVRFCRKHRVRAVMNGHRHLSYNLRLPSGTTIMASPSSTLGDELAHDPRPQLIRYDVADQPSGHTVGIYRQVVRLPI